jgi:S-formylglutathione hydrolase FrmB
MRLALSSPFPGGILRKLAIILILLTGFAIAQTPRTQTIKFFSQALQQEMPYVVFLPASYDKTNIRYPVLYLLHGLTGHASSWDLRSGIQKYAEPYDVIIVAVEGGNSWYVNSATNLKEKYEDYFLGDVIKDVRSKFRINDGEYARAVAGISAGGYAAINLALKNPRVFAFAGSLSGAISAARDPELEKELKDFKLGEIFGPAGSKTRQENDPFLLAEKAQSPTTYIWMACGTEDDTIISNHAFADLLRRKHIPYEMHEWPGEHEWTFWTQALPDMLRAVNRRFLQLSRE